jgi:hypothetical protein
MKLVQIRYWYVLVQIVAGGFWAFGLVARPAHSSKKPANQPRIEVGTLFPSPANQPRIEVGTLFPSPAKQPRIEVDSHQTP